MRAIALAVFLAAALLTAGSVTYTNAAGCGIVPIKPIPPVGCKDLKPECQCDERGQNCKWVWKCVK